MRVRLSLLPPFRESKILLPLPLEVTTISELRRHLVRSLSAISSVVDHAREVVLEIEGFELLGGSGVGVIEEKDVVCVRVAASSSKPNPSHPVQEAAKKRKRIHRRSSPGEIAPIPAKRARKSSASAWTPTSTLVSAMRPREVVPKSAVTAAADVNAAAADVNAAAAARIPIAARKRSGSGSSSVSSSSASSSSSDSSLSSSAASSSSSDSDASSSSSSASSSASSSSAASSASERPAKLDGSVAFPRPPSSVITNSLALGTAPPPPGQGKPETHNRNLRRRKARQMKKLASEQAEQSAQPLATSLAVAVVMNGHTSARDAPPNSHTEGGLILATTTPTNPGLQMPKEMANRNKRKGFFREMNALQGTRTVFSDQAAAAAAAGVVSAEQVENEGHGERGERGEGTPQRVKQLASDGVHTPISSMTTPTPTTTPRATRLPKIVPPSEKVLPSNVFVTSREFERVRPPRDEVNGYANGVDRATEEAEEAREAEDDQAGLQAEDDEAMWSRVEQSWDKLPVLISEELSNIKEGTLVAWKELELDLNTFSPELKLHIARVTAVSADGSARLDRLKRPVPDGEVWGEYEQEQGEAGAEETCLRLSKEDVQAGVGKWRLVPSLSA